MNSSSENERSDPDRKQLIYEAFRIDNISNSECRSIFLDWALSLPEDWEMQSAIRAMLAIYQDDHDGHPMIDVLRSGIEGRAEALRKGGWRSRRKPAPDDSPENPKQ